MYKKGMKLRYKLEKPSHFWSEGLCSYYELGSVEEIAHIEDGIIYLGDYYKATDGKNWGEDGNSFPIEVIEVMFDVVEE